MQSKHLNTIPILLKGLGASLGLVCKDAKPLGCPQYFSLDKTKAKLLRQTKGNEGIMICSFLTIPFNLYI